MPGQTTSARTKTRSEDQRSTYRDLFSVFFFICRYLEDEYLLNCPKDQNILSGLGKLPLNFKFYDDTADPSTPALQELPTGEKLSGATTYETLMPFFTTLEITPTELRQKAVTRRDELYRQVNAKQ